MMCGLFSYTFILDTKHDVSVGRKEGRSTGRQFSLMEILEGKFGYDTYQTDWVSGMNIFFCIEENIFLQDQ